MSFTDTIRRRDPIDEKRLTWLGRAGGWTYARHGGRVLAVNDRPWSDEMAKEYQLKAGERLVTRQREMRLEDGERMKVTGQHLAIEVEDDAWEKIATQRSSKAKPSGARTWDALAEFRRPTTDVRRLPLRESTNPDVGALQAQLGIEAAQPWIERPQGGLSDTSPSGLVDYLQRRGITLELGRGRLIARSEKPVNVADRQLMERAETLIIGELSGIAVLCSLCSEPATTIVLPRAAVCAEHAQ